MHSQQNIKLVVTLKRIWYYVTEMNIRGENTVQRKGSLLKCWFVSDEDVIITNITIIPY